MISPHKYFELRIDVFDRPIQRAEVLSDVRPKELISAILEEFGEELDYLGTDPSAYRLRKNMDNVALDPERPLSDLVGAGEHLVLEEADLVLPPGTLRPAQAIYVREVASQQAFRIPWLPAIIGRVDPVLPENNLVVVDLTMHPCGSRVSRRHLRISREDDGYYIQAASANPATLLRDKDTTITIPSGDGKEQLHPRDLIRLDRSQITFKFIMRDAQRVAVDVLQARYPELDRTS